jgi:hypothetical protein
MRRQAGTSAVRNRKITLDEWIRQEGEQAEAHEEGRESGQTCGRLQRSHVSKQLHRWQIRSKGTHPAIYCDAFDSRIAEKLQSALKPMRAGVLEHPTSIYLRHAAPRWRP